MIRTLTAVAFTLLTTQAAWSADAAAPTDASGSVQVSPSPAADSTPATSAPASSSSSPSSSYSSAADATPVKPADSGVHFMYVPKPSDVVTGKDDAPVTIVEYASLSCPHCSHFYVNSLPTLTTKYIDTGKVRLVYRDYPINPPALKAAELVQCADPDRRHAFIKVLFTTQLKWAYDNNFRDSLANIAVLGGMDRLKFESCMNNKTIEKAVVAVEQEASEKFKVNSTPTFFINGLPYKGDHEAAAMSKDIDYALSKAAQK